MADTINRALYCNIGGGQRILSNLYPNINGSRKDMTAMYGNIGGASKQMFPTTISSTTTVPSGPTVYTWNKYTLNSNTTGVLLSEAAGDMEYKYGEMPTIYSVNSYDLVPDSSSSNGYSIRITDYSTYGRLHQIASLPSSGYWVFEPSSSYNMFGGGYLEDITIGGSDGVRISGASKYYPRSAIESYSCGSYIGQVTSTSSTAYPNNSYSGNYWYIYQGSSQSSTNTTIVYDQIKAIQSTGTQYIDTGFKPNQNTRIIMDITPLSSATAFVFGSRHNSSANSESRSFSFAILGENSARSDYGSVENTISTSVLKRGTIDKNKNVTNYNGITVTGTAQTFQSSYNLALFSTNTAGTQFSTKLSATLYSCKIYDNGTLVRDFVPVKGSNGSVGLYDLVNKKFYGNAGSGAFTAIT